MDLARSEHEPPEAPVIELTLITCVAPPAGVALVSIVPLTAARLPTILRASVLASWNTCLLSSIRSAVPPLFTTQPVLLNEPAAPACGTKDIGRLGITRATRRPSRLRTFTGAFRAVTRTAWFPSMRTRAIESPSGRIVRVRASISKPEPLCTSEEPLCSEMWFAKT